MIDWYKPDQGFDWAIEADNKIKKFIIENNHQALIDYKTLGKEVKLAIPTPEHYHPLLYCLALKQVNEKLTILVQV